ncbi:helix-turn-helix domain-containing protein [Coprococcus comes]|uniref:helix-turn-helix domain-containing protein n=1 Tax=Coprococcus comes TaxID=410072 RepID=UPI003A873826
MYSKERERDVMQEQECTLDVKTIEAAVAGEKWALEKVLEYYGDYIEEMASLDEEQPDGSVKKYVDEDLKQEIILKLLEEIPNFPLEEAKKEAAEE